MNYSVVRFVLGRIMFVEAVLLCPSLIVGFVYLAQDGWQPVMSIVYTIALLLVISLAVGLRKPAKMDLYAREGLVIVGLSWFLLSFFGSLPFVFNGNFGFVDAFFETASGFSTTGSSVLNNIESVEHAILFWRSFTHLIGGMGVLVFSLAIMPKTGSESVHIMKAEVPGPIFGKVLSRVRGTAQILYLIYLAMTAILVILLVLGKMPVFDSFCHAFGAAGTGGFSVKSNSILFYNSAYIDIVLGIAMIMFGVNFNLYFLIIYKKFKAAAKSEELRWFLGIIAGAVAVICIFLWPSYDSFPKMLREVFFTVTSMISTTGFTTADFGKWPLITHIVLLILMFCGAMAGSTGGGIKTSRIAIYIKSSYQEVRQNISPNRRLPVRFEGKPLDSNIQRSIFRYLSVYVIIFFVCMLIVSADTQNFSTAFSSVVATLNNIGPGLGKVGPSANYSGLNDISKVTLSVAMIAGRLEIFPVLILFSPRTWRRI